MTENNQNPIPEMEDISSTSKEFREQKNPVMNYANGIFKNLGNIIKAIAFVIAFGVIIVGFVIAALLSSFVLSLGVIIVFTIIAACLFFPIYGIGHIVCQNNEILKQLENK